MRLRLTLVASAVMLVVYVVLAAAIFALQYRSRFDTVDADLAGAATNAALDAARRGPRGGPGPGRWEDERRRGPGSLEAGAYGAPGTVVVVRDRDGDVVDSTVADPPELPADEDSGRGAAEGMPALTTEHADGRPWRVASVSWPGGVVQAAVPVGAVVGQLGLLGVALGAGALVAVVLAAGATWATAGLALAPLRRMRQVAEQVAATEDPSARVPDEQRKDEIGRLASAFNSMLGRLQGAQARAHEALDTQRRFLADASHELRTPVTSLRGNVELLQRHPDLDPGERERMVTEMSEESRRLSGLVEDLLDLARMEQGAAGSGGWIDVAGVCGDAAAALRARAVTDGREVVVTDEGGGTVVWGDAEVLRRILDLLCDNALVHGEDRVDVRVRPPGEGWLRVEVADEGEGVPPEDRDRIFGRFARGTNSAARPGSGLGLAIAAALATGLGARVGLHETEPATFVLWLPVGTST